MCAKDISEISGGKRERGMKERASPGATAMTTQEGSSAERGINIKRNPSKER